MFSFLYTNDCRPGSIIADFAVNIRLFLHTSNSTQIGIELISTTEKLSYCGSLGNLPLTKGYIGNITVNILNDGMYH